jgi:hypothetical protein
LISKCTFRSTSRRAIMPPRSVKRSISLTMRTLILLSTTRIAGKRGSSEALIKRTWLVHGQFYTIALAVQPIADKKRCNNVDWRWYGLRERRTRLQAKQIHNSYPKWSPPAPG